MKLLQHMRTIFLMTGAALASTYYCPDPDDVDKALKIVYLANYKTDIKGQKWWVTAPNLNVAAPSTFEQMIVSYGANYNTRGTTTSLLGEALIGPFCLIQCNYKDVNNVFFTVLTYVLGDDWELIYNGQVVPLNQVMQNMAVASCTNPKNCFIQRKIKGLQIKKVAEKIRDQNKKGV